MLVKGRYVVVLYVVEDVKNTSDDLLSALALMIALGSFKNYCFRTSLGQFCLEADFNNLETSITISPIPTTRVHKDHPVSQIIGDLSLTTQTRSMTRVVKDQGGLSYMFDNDFHTCMFVCFLSQEEPKRVHQALKDPSWIEAMQEELLQFKMQKLWVLVDLPHGKKSLWLFLAYASFMGFMVYQMDVKSAFLYGTIEEEVYVCQPLGFEDPDHPDKVYKVVKALYGLHQAPRAYLCKSFKKLMKDKFQMSSMGELTFFLGLQVKQKKDGIFISQDKYVAEILRKFGLTEGKSASTPIDTEKPLLKDHDGKDVDVHIYRSMISSLMYLTSSRPDIMFATNIACCSKWNGVFEKNVTCFIYLKCWLPHHTTNGSQFTMFNPHKNSSPDQTVSGKDSSNPLMANNLLKIVWYSIHHVTLNEELASPKANGSWANGNCDSPLLGVNTPRSDEDRLELMELTVFLLPKDEKVGIGVNAIDLQVNDVTRLQALVDKKKVVVTEAAIRECMSAKRTSWNEFSSSMASAIICLSTGDASKKEIEEEGDADEHVEEVHTGNDSAAHGDDSATHGEVPTVTEEPSIPSPTPTISPPQPPQDLPSTSQVQQTPPHLLQEALDACAALTRRVEHLEYDKVAQALEITKLKRRVKKLEKRNHVRVLKLRRLQRVRTSQRVDTFDDTVMDDESNQGRMIAEMDKDDVVVLMDDKDEDKKVEEAKVIESAQDKTEPTEVQEVVDVVTTAKLIIEVVTAASETVTAASAIIPTTEPQVLTATLTAAPARVVPAPSRRRKGVVIRDPEEESTTSAIIPAETKPKDKGKGILLKAKEDLVVKRYQAIKRKPQIEAQARKNMMMYLKNIDGFKLDYFKGMSYDDIRLIFEAKFNSNVDLLIKTKEQIEEEENRALQMINETLAEKAAKRRKLNKEGEDLKRYLEIVLDEEDDVYTEATPLARKVPVVDYEIIELNNKPYYKIIRADGTHQLYISFLTLLKNFDREDLEAL
nr:hypothetical protein [Tanacetum cinerariifolium]